MQERYECDKCGACCKGHLIVEADWVDLSREPQLLKADSLRAGWQLDEALADLEDPGAALIIACGSACPFLNAENHCKIYPTRPTVCVGLEAGDEQCQAARQEAGLLPLLPVPELCECEMPGYFNSGVPGVLAHLEDGEVTADAKVERCDVCNRYPSDQAAREKLISLGVITAAEAAKERFIVHCFAVVKVTMPAIVAADHREAAAIAIDDFDFNRQWAAAEYTDEFTEFLVDVVGDSEHDRSKHFDSDLKEY